MRGADGDRGVAVPANLEELQAREAAAWKTLVEAALGLANAVNAAALTEEVRAAEQTLGNAARAYAATTTALMEAMRLRPPRRARRR